MNGMVLAQAVIPQELCDYAQRLHYELEGYRALMMSILRCGEFKYNEETYKKFIEDYQKANMVFHLLIEEIKCEYYPEHKDLCENISVNILFSDNLVRFIKPGSSAQCSLCPEVEEVG